MLFSANLGLLWTDRSLVEGIFAAKQAGFDAVECHWPYATTPSLVKQALDETGLSMLSLNTQRGDVSAGENGLCALPEKNQQAKEAIVQAVAYAAEIGCAHIHVMAGNSAGQKAEEVFVENLTFACELAAASGIGVLIEPLNPYDAPGYFLNDLTQARRIIEAVGKDQVRLMFDCYHIQILHGDITRQLRAAYDLIGHIQFASVPDRSAPDEGELNYKYLFSVIASLGYQAPLGAEYKPAKADTQASLGWLREFKD